MGVRQPADDHFWGERNAVIELFLETLFRYQKINIHLNLSNTKILL